MFSVDKIFETYGLLDATEYQLRGEDRLKYKIHVLNEDRHCYLPKKKKGRYRVATEALILIFIMRSLQR